jgi:hypothetical protein
MRGILWFGLLALLGATLGLAVQTSPGQEVKIGKEEEAFVNAINQERANKKLPPMKVNAKLSEAAVAYAKVCSEKGQTREIYKAEVALPPAKAAGFEAVSWDATSGKGLTGQALYKQMMMDSKMGQGRLAKAELTAIGVGLFKDAKGTEWFTYYMTTSPK